MNTLSHADKVAVLRCLVEGNSVRSTVRITGVSKKAVMKLLADAGQACLEFQDKMLVNLPCKRVQCDEVWCFCYCKDKNVPERMKGQPGVGSMWTWTAICADTKLICTWALGARDAAMAHMLMGDLQQRLAHKVQLTTDGNLTYLEAVADYFAEIDYAQLIKMYGAPEEKPDTRYSPAKCLGAKKSTVMGAPDPDHVSTSYVERSNLTMRMHMRRFTRLTNGFSKKAANLAYALSLHFMHYNFIRFHQTLRMPPALKAGIIDRAMSIDDIVHMLPLAVAKKRGPYKKRAKAAS